MIRPRMVVSPIGSSALCVLSDRGRMRRPNPAVRMTACNSGPVAVIDAFLLLVLVTRPAGGIAVMVRAVVTPSLALASSAAARRGFRAGRQGAETGGWAFRVRRWLAAGRGRLSVRHASRMRHDDDRIMKQCAESDRARDGRSRHHHGGHTQRGTCRSRAMSGGGGPGGSRSGPGWPARSP